jgi:hypothetical protein
LSFFQAQISATTNTIPIPIVTTPLTGPWATTTGNTDGSFSLITGAYTAPATGVYEFSLAGSFFNSLGVALVANNFFTFNVNGIAKVQTYQSDNYVAGANRLFSLTSVFSLNANDVVTITFSAGAVGLVLVSSIYPGVATTLFNGKQIA